MGLMAMLQTVWASEFTKGVGALAIISGALGLLRYYAKRRIDKVVDADPYHGFQKAVALHKEMSSLQIGVEEVQRLMAVVEGKPAQVAAINAHYYSSRAKQLAHNQLHLIATDPLPANATQSEMNVHAELRYQKAKAMLAQVLASYLATAMEHERNAVRQAQDAWLAWLESEGVREGVRWSGGSMEHMMVSSRLEALTRERIASLELDLGGTELQGGRVLVVERSYTPSNLLEHVKQGVPAERVRSLLGTPTSIEGNTWIYQYIDTQVQITFSNEVVAQAAVLLIDGKIYKGSGAAWGDFILGELTIGEIVDDWLITPEFFTSMRTTEVYCRVRCGPAGAWEEGIVGALMVFSGVGMLAQVELEWDYEDQTMKGDWKSALVNYVVSGSSDEPPRFNWFISA